MAPNVAPIMRLEEFYESFASNRLSNQIGCALSEELSHILKYPGRWNNVQQKINGHNAEAKVLREIENLRSKMSNRPRADLEITVKLMLCSISAKNIQNAAKMALKIFDTAYIDKFVLLGEPFIEEAEESVELPKVSKISSFFSMFWLLTKKQKSKKVMKNVTSALINVWPALEDLCKKKTVLKVGLANVDTECFKTLFNSVKIPPTILELPEDSIDNSNVSFLKFCEQNKINVVGNHNLQTASDEADFESASDFGLEWTSIYKIRVPETDEYITKGYIASKSQPLQD